MTQEDLDQIKLDIEVLIKLRPCVNAEHFDLVRDMIHTTAQDIVELTRRTH